MTTIRAFIALSLPPEITAVLAGAGRELAELTPPRAVRWVRPEAMHLTLRFLGETAEAQLPALAVGLDTVANHQAPFALALGELGCFPNGRRPRVIWAGVVDPDGALAPLKRGIDERLAPLGWLPETNPFVAHLTLGRVKDHGASLALPWGRRFAPLSWPVTAVHLIQSDLRPGGPVYTIRHTSQFGG